MLIRFLQTLAKPGRCLPKGSIHDVPENEARHLIARGVAEEAPSYTPEALDARAKQLDEREKAVAEREAAVAEAEKAAADADAKGGKGKQKQTADAKPSEKP